MKHSYASIASLLALLLAGCDNSPPAPPPSRDAGGTDAGRFDASLDGATADAGPFDASASDASGGDDAGPLDAAARDAAGFDASPFDAGPPPASGAYADLTITGAYERTYRLVPPANQVRCMETGTRPNLYVGLSMSPDGLSGDSLEIDAAGVMTGSYTPRTGSERRGNFAMLYRVSLFESYGIDSSTTPCTFEVTSMGGGELEATFDCQGMVNLGASASERVNATGRVRCTFP